MTQEEKEVIMKTWLYCYDRGFHQTYEELLFTLLKEESPPLSDVSKLESGYRHHNDS
jgi:hypothetical protein